MGHAHHCHFQHSGQQQQGVFDLARIDVEPADDDQVLSPIDQPQVTVCIGICDITCGEPAVVVRPSGPIGPVPAEDIRAAHEDLARVAVLDRVAVGVPQFDVDAIQGLPHEPCFRTSRLQGGRDHRRALGHPVALPDGLAHKRLVLSHHIAGQRRSAGHEQPHLGKCLCQALMNRPRNIHRGRTGHVGDMVLAHSRERRRRVEPVHQNDGRSLPGHQTQSRVEGVDMEQRQNTQHRILRRHTRGIIQLGQLLEVGQQAAMGEHCRLGPA